MFKILNKEKIVKEESGSITGTGNHPLSSVNALVMVRPSGYNDKFSLNLYKFLKKHGEHYRKVYFSPWNCITGEKDVVYSPDKTLASNIYIGFVCKDGYLMGARLTEICCNGVKTKTWSHPPKDYAPISDFWERYSKNGKCVIDPEHTFYYQKDRYVVGGTLRTCKWCGRTERLRIVERVVKDEVWEPQT